MNGSVSLGLVAILLALSSSHGSAEDIVHLTKDNFAAMTEGKSVVIMFYAPWVSVICFSIVYYYSSVHTASLTHSIVRP